MFVNKSRNPSASEILSQLFVGNTNFSEFVNTSMLRNEMLKEREVVQENISKQKENIATMESNKYLYRFLGLLSSMLGKPSSYR